MVQDDNKEMMRQLAGAGESVLAVAFLAGFGAWGGCALDQHFHSTPWFAIGLSMLGLCLGMARMVMKVLQSEKK